MVDELTNLEKEPPTPNAGKTPPTNPLTRRERRTAAIVAGCVLATIIVATLVCVLVSRAADPQGTRQTCVTVALASSMGGGVEHQCGDAAREWCRQAYAQHDAHAQAVQTQCRAAGIRAA
ncbi:hypothetical protein CG716_03670 [Mycolicibacterium sphagni]|uniref:Uncharacterized protein n=1 Tax=Mycolicibacterium sphagni TaxID=1786 RepID=A0A255E2R3_9MYCO|nr:hypothetical protein CG716_03670 [Mycolicibacterium sphagni]